MQRKLSALTLMLLLVVAVDFSSFSLVYAAHEPAATAKVVLKNVEVKAGTPLTAYVDDGIALAPIK